MCWQHQEQHDLSVQQIKVIKGKQDRNRGQAFMEHILSMQTFLDHAVGPST